MIKPLPAQALQLEYIRPTAWYDRPMWRLLTPLEFEDLTVQAGFCTDLGSIPRLFWAILDPASTYAHATVLHDYALDYYPTRYQADQLFNRALKALSTPLWMRFALVLGVTIYSHYQCIKTRKPYK